MRNNIFDRNCVAWKQKVDDIWKIFHKFAFKMINIHRLRISCSKTQAFLNPRLNGIRYTVYLWKYPKNCFSWKSTKFYFKRFKYFVRKTPFVLVCHEFALLFAQKIVHSCETQFTSYTQIFFEKFLIFIFVF